MAIAPTASVETFATGPATTKHQDHLILSPRTTRAEVTADNNSNCGSERRNVGAGGGDRSPHREQPPGRPILQAE